MLINMQTGPLLSSRFYTSHEECNEVFNVVIAYDNVAAGQRAMRLLSYLRREHGESIRFQPQPWRFDLLGHPDWRQFAVADALKADLLIISASGGSGLPTAIRSWITACFARKRGANAAVVGLCGSEGKMDDADSPRLQFLQSAAREAGLEFFAPLPTCQHALTKVQTEPGQLKDWTGGLDEFRNPAARQQLGEVPLPAPSQAFRQITPYRHWGINE